MYHPPTIMVELAAALYLAGSGRVNVLTRTVTAARDAVVTGASGQIETHVSDTCKCGSFSFIFTHPPKDIYRYI